ncbi:MAG: AMP-binding protein [Pseudomonadota bacterium]
MDSLPAVFAEAARQNANKIALVDGKGRTITFAELKARSDGFAAACRDRGLERGSRALIAMPLGIDLYIALAGIWQAGASAIFPEPALGLAGLRHAARTVRPDAYVSSGMYRLLRWIVPELWSTPLLLPTGRAVDQAPDASICGEDTALISFTSGSTGAPKAIARSHSLLMAQYHAVAPLLGSERAERDLVAFPVFALANLAAGRTSILPNWKVTKPGHVSAASLCNWVERQEVTRLLIPPVLLERLADVDLPGSLTTVFTGGGPVFPDVLERVSRKSPHLRVVMVYGSTEAEPIAELEASSLSQEDTAAMQNGAGLCAGQLVPSIRLRIVDHEIQVAGDHVNQGYLDPRQDADTKVQEKDLVWHRTGDAGRLDHRGCLWLLGRHAEVQATKNGTLFPFALETAARAWPGVSRAALCCLPSGPVLAVEGDRSYLPQWMKEATRYGITDTRHLASLPKDKRHRSKTDYERLRILLVRSTG